MIVLVARRLNQWGTRFEFKIYPAEGDAFTADKPDAVTEQLKILGISGAEKLIRHACDWGMIEIPEQSPPPVPDDQGST